MRKVAIEKLSRRERQIMDLIYERGEMSAQDIQSALDDAPGYSAVRAFLKILETKGQLTHFDIGGKYVYKPTESWTAVARKSIERVVETFFEGSLEKAVATLLSSSNRPSADELSRLEEMIQQAKLDEKESQSASEEANQ